MEGGERMRSAEGYLYYFIFPLGQLAETFYTLSLPAPTSFQVTYFTFVCRPSAWPSQPQASVARSVVGTLAACPLLPPEALGGAECILPTIHYVEEPVLVLVLLVDGGHQRSCGGQNVVHKDEDGLLRTELDTLADNVDKLPDSEICGHEVLLLVDVRDVAFLCLLNNHRYPVVVLFANACGLCLAFLERVLLLKDRPR